MQLLKRHQYESGVRKGECELVLSGTEWSLSKRPGSGIGPSLHSVPPAVLKVESCLRRQNGTGVRKGGTKREANLTLGFRDLVKASSIMAS